MNDLTDLATLILMFVIGAILGALYLGSLWFSVQRMRRGRYPALWLVSSLAVRMLVLGFAFYFILGEGHWERLLMALAGFVTLRTLILRRVRRQIPDGMQKGKLL